MNQRIEKDQLINYLPHKGKMFLLSRVTDYDVENYSITVETDITEDFIFYEESIGGIPNWCTFEIMAQAISALTGIHDSFYNIEPKAGCILSITGFESNTEVFKLGTTLKATAVEEYRDEESGIYRYKCATFVSPDAEESAVEATITVMQTENLESIINR
ncbi:3-hydroxylacyl-ACP dehydratase [Treponema sp.]|uniref:ApeP family dehydratase n=1 Tax=Treponema sp. TaxID=166 RepID=UPI00298DA5A5|nr:3-hydroxylacyl-ACP dehydratase [Treponema sp.]MCQ2241376.1 3-hydroxylacyl-ACP dehydratase [Treponema sp.]